MRFAIATHHGTGLCGVQKRLLTTALLSALAGDAMSLGTHYEYDAHKVELIAAFPSLEPPSQPCAPAFHSCLIPISLNDMNSIPVPTPIITTLTTVLSTLPTILPTLHTITGDQTRFSFPPTNLRFRFPPRR